MYIHVLYGVWWRLCLVVCAFMIKSGMLACVCLSCDLQECMTTRTEDDDDEYASLEHKLNMKYVMHFVYAGCVCLGTNLYNKKVYIYWNSKSLKLYIMRFMNTSMNSFNHFINPLSLIEVCIHTLTHTFILNKIMSIETN